MRTYVVTLKHDAGKVSIKTWASDKQQAIKQVLSYECAPISALVNCKESI